MAYVSDRQRVEEVLPVHCMMGVVMHGAEENDPVTKQCLEFLRIAANDAVEDLDKKDREKIWRRSQRAYEDAIKTYSAEGQSVAKFGLIVFYWLRAMLDGGWIQLPEDGAFQKAMDLLLPGLDPHANISELDRSAQKQAPKFHARLQALGYYRMVELNG